MTDAEDENELMQDIAEDELQARQLALLFGKDIVEQARLVDIADLNITDEMSASIAEGIKNLKQLKSDPEKQRHYISGLSLGLQLLLCLWIMDMGLLQKIKKVGEG